MEINNRTIRLLERSIWLPKKICSLNNENFHDVFLKLFNGEKIGKLILKYNYE